MTSGSPNPPAASKLPPARWRDRRWWRAGRLGLRVYLLYLLALFLGQRWILYPGRALTPAPAPPSVQVVWLDTSAGRTEAWFLRAPRAPGRAPAVLYSHGNAALMQNALWQVHDLPGHGYHVLMIEYPGYGRSEGSPNEDNLVAAEVAGYDWLAAQPIVDPHRIIAWGQSLGGGPACALTRGRPVAGLLLQSTFTSISDLSWRFLAPPFLVSDRWDNEDAVRAYTGPVLLLHGRQDRTVPYACSERLAAVAAHGRLVSFDADHNDLPHAADGARFEHVVLDFLAAASRR